MVRRIFELAAGGNSMWSIKRTLARDGIPSPRGGEWHVQVIRRMIHNEIYRPHAHREVADLVEPEVAQKLDSSRDYGILWFGKKDVAKTSGVLNGVTGGVPGGKKRSFRERPREEQIPVPVPDAGVPGEWVAAARANLRGGRKFGGDPERSALWELAGMASCACGAPMVVRSGGGPQALYRYYVCSAKRRLGRCPAGNDRYHRAEDLERVVVGAVDAELLTDRETLEAHMDAAIARAGSAGFGNPGAGERALAGHLAELSRKRAKYQEMYAADAMTLGELKEKLADLEDERASLETERQRLGQVSATVEDLRRRKRTVLEMWGVGLQLGLFWFPPRLRTLTYGLLGLGVVVSEDGTLEVEASWDANTMAAIEEVEAYARALRDIDERLRAQADPQEDPAEGLVRLERELGRLRAGATLGTREPTDARW